MKKICIEITTICHPLSGKYQLTFVVNTANRCADAGGETMTVAGELGYVAERKALTVGSYFNVN